MKIEDLLTHPEGKTLEFKQDLSSPKNILRTVTAFANTAGGILIIGRADDGSMVGVADVLSAEERLANLIADNIAPAMMPEIEVVTVAEKTLLAIRVAHWPGPFYLKEKGPEEGIYVRLGSTNRKADRTTLEALRRLRQNSSFDQLPYVGMTESDLDQEALKRWFAHRDRPLSASSLESLGVLVRQGGGLVVSNGGMILFGAPDVRRQCFPDAKFSCARFRGRDKSEFIDRQEMEGLFEALADVPKFISRSTRLASRITGMQRDDIPEYSPIAIREVLVNAVAHADYAFTGMRFFVSIFDDRMEVQSPGMFPFGMTLENFKAGVSRIRNRVICRVLHEMGLMEEWGSGYQRISAACRQGGYPEPEWLELGSCVRVIFRPHPHIPEDDTINDSGNDTINDRINERQEWFLTEISRHIPVKAEHIVQQWGVGVATARRDIAELKRMDLIEFEGPLKTGSYRLKRKKEQ